MGTRDTGEPSVHSRAFHEEQLPLFDAYVTNELDEDERAHVEHNLHHCQECQHLLAQITRLRHELGTLSETENAAVLADARLHSQSILPAVIARIERSGNKRNHFTVERARQGQTSFRPPSAYSPALLARKRRRAISLGLGAAVCCVLLLVGLIVTLQNASTSTRKGPISRPPPVVWIRQQQLTLVQNSAGVFALKDIDITTTKEFRFYYAFHSPHPGTIHAVAVSSLNAGQQPITLSTTVLSLGTIDDINVGVIRVQYLDRIGQAITLRITLPGEGGARWQLTPLKQRLAEPHPEGGSFYEFSIDQHLFPDVIWSGPWIGTAGPSHYSMISLFKNATGTRYIFFEIDYSGKIMVITRERCIQLTGERACQ